MKASPLRLLAFGTLVAAAGTAVLETQDATAADSAVIFMYHHVATGTPSSTSVTPETFVAHLEYLESNGYRVVPLVDTLEALEEGRPLPEKSVVITFDDGYSSVLTHAYPALRQRGWPFTVFVSPAYIDQGFGGFLSWEELRTLAEGGATVANHTLSHAHLVRRMDGESGSGWRQRIRREIVDAQARIDAEIGDAAISVVAYPYGEYDAALKDIVSDLGLSGLGQHSGAVGTSSDWQAVPRYPVATGYDSLDDFALRARSRALRLRVDESAAPINAAPDGRPVLRAEVLDKDIRRAELACYASNQGRMSLEWLDSERTRFEARPREALRPGRTKYNCTAPSASESGVYHWYGQLWMTRNSDGSWYTE